MKKLRRSDVAFFGCTLLGYQVKVLSRSYNLYVCSTKDIFQYGDLGLENDFKQAHPMNQLVFFMSMTFYEFCDYSIEAAAPRRTLIILDCWTFFYTSTIDTLNVHK